MSGGQRKDAAWGSSGQVQLALRPLAVACAVLGRARAEVLLEGLHPSARDEVHRLLEAFRSQGSGGRQARLAVEFGLRPEADARVRRLLAEAPPGLRHALLQCLPAYQRSLAPEPATAALAGAPSPLLKRLAERLVREANR